MVLHTWGQTLQHHPHVHCVVPGGGPSLDGTRWVACRPGFLLPVRVLSRLFRRLFLQELEIAFAAGKLRFFTNLANLAEPQAFARRLRELQRLDWVVYAKPPFGGPEQVLAYLGRYTHRVAIANRRLLSLADGKIRFTWKDYRADGKTKVMTLDADDFKVANAGGSPCRFRYRCAWISRRCSCVAWRGRRRMGRRPGGFWLLR
jgi:hypothetical protein